MAFSPLPLPVKLVLKILVLSLIPCCCLKSSARSQWLFIVSGKTVPLLIRMFVGVYYDTCIEEWLNVQRKCSWWMPVYVFWVALYVIWQVLRWNRHIKYLCVDPMMTTHHTHLHTLKCMKRKQHKHQHW